MLNHAPECFAEEGYCVFPRVFGGAEVKSNRRLLDEATDVGMPGPTILVNLDRPNYIGEPHTRDDRWLEICRHPRLLDAVQSILGPNLILVYSSVFIKRPRSMDKVPWHQDNTYWPSVHGTDVLTVWLAIDDADAENSAMIVIPGSHAGYRERATVPTERHEMLSKKIVVTPEMEARAVTLQMAAGSVSIHDSFILHASRSNHSGRRRAGYTIRYCSCDTAWVDMDLHSLPVYLVRGEARWRGERYIDLRPNR